jgi:NADH-quinone oxidoreductase subunit N
VSVVHNAVPGADLRAVLPEGILAAGGMGLLLLGASLRKQRPGLLAGATIVILALAAGAALLGIGHYRSAFDDRIALDGFATFAKVLLCAAGALAVIAAYSFLKQEEAPQPELFALVLFATTGMMLMASAADLLVLFVALETFSLAFYVLAAFRRGRRDSQEASLKYFLTGSFASAFLLYGVALCYGALGTTRFPGSSTLMAASSVPVRGLLPAGLALVLVGLAFKAAAVPFHMWTPDVYDGAPAPLSGFLAAGSKIAAYAAALRLLTSAFPLLLPQWRPAIGAVAVLTMVVGTVVGVAQTNVKRLLAYSAIAHSGFLLVGVAAANPEGISGSLFYLAAYSFTVLGAFAVVYAVGGPGEERISIDDYRGLGRRHPWLAGALALMLLSLAGIPPTIGFWAKVEVFGAGMKAGLGPLVVVGVLTSTIAAAFYLRLVAVMFLDGEEGWASTVKEKVAPGLGLAVAIASLAVGAVGLAPDFLIELAKKATFAIR